MDLLFVPSTGTMLSSNCTQRHRITLTFKNDILHLTASNLFGWAKSFIFLNIINMYTKRERSIDVDKNIRGESGGGPINCSYQEN